MYVKNFLFVSHSYLSQRDDVLCGWPPAEPPAPPASPAAEPVAAGPAGGDESCHDRQTEMPERVAGPG